MRPFIEVRQRLRAPLSDGTHKYRSSRAIRFVQDIIQIFGQTERTHPAPLVNDRMLNISIQSKRIFLNYVMLQEHLTLHKGESFMYMCTFYPKVSRMNGNMYSHRNRYHLKDCMRQCLLRKTKKNQIPTHEF